jgi:hypothetical protein
MTGVGPATRRYVLERDGWQCRMPVCLHPAWAGGRVIDPALDGTGDEWSSSLDHVQRRADGGSNHPANLRAAHRRCNWAAGGLPGRLDGLAVGQRLDEASLAALDAAIVPPPGVTDGVKRGPAGGLVRGPWGGVYDRLRQAERDERAARGQTPLKVPGVPRYGPGDPATLRTRVLSRQCSDCIFRPGNPMHLAPGRLRDMVEEARSRERFITCHQTLPGVAPRGFRPAVCRGFFDRYQTAGLTLIGVLFGFTEVDPPELPGRGGRARRRTLWESARTPARPVPGRGAAPRRT